MFKKKHNKNQNKHTKKRFSLRSSITWFNSD